MHQVSSICEPVSISFHFGYSKQHYTIAYMLHFILPFWLRADLRLSPMTRAFSSERFFKEKMSLDRPAISLCRGRERDREKEGEGGGGRKERKRKRERERERWREKKREEGEEKSERGGKGEGGRNGVKERRDVVWWSRRGSCEQ